MISVYIHLTLKFLIFSSGHSGPTFFGDIIIIIIISEHGVRFYRRLQEVLFMFLI